MVRENENKVRCLVHEVESHVADHKSEDQYMSNSDNEDDLPPPMDSFASLRISSEPTNLPNIDDNDDDMPRIQPFLSRQNAYYRSKTSNSYTNFEEHPAAA